MGVGSVEYDTYCTKQPSAELKSPTAAGKSQADMRVARIVVKKNPPGSPSKLDPTTPIWFPLESKATTE